MAFSRGPNPIWSEFSTTGGLFDDTYYAFFLENISPYNFQTVYQDPNGMTPWSNPIQFQANGCLPDNIFGDTSATYRIEFHQGPNQSDPLIGNPIQNYVFGNGGTSPVTDSLLFTTNMITNPQFSDIDFETPITIATAGTYDIAPGWSLVLSGAGSTTVTQGENSGNAGIPGSPPYYLTFANSGWTTVQLIQSFSNNGAIFSGGAVAIALAANATGSAQTLTVSYAPSNGSATTLFTGSILTGDLAVYKNAVNIPDSTSTDDGTAAYVNIVFTLPPAGEVSLTNIQIVGQSDNLSASFTNPADAPLFQEQTYQRTVDQEFNVYKSQLANKPIPSYLVGWDFPLNPSQFFGASAAAQAVGANKSYYVADQTILFQSANSGITTGFGTANGLGLLAAVNTKIGVIQYFNQVQASKILTDNISCNIFATATTASMAGIKITISLWYTTDGSLPSVIGSNNSLVATLDANGKPATFNGTWTEIKRENLQDAVATIIGGVPADYSFNGWLENYTASQSATFMAIVVGTETVTAGDSLTISSVSSVGGDIPTRPAPQTEDAVLRECQYYYETSYNPGVVPGTSTLNGIQNMSLPVITDGSSTSCYPKDIFINFKQTKYAAPTTFTFYTPTGTVANVSCGVNNYDGSVISAATNTAITKWTNVYLSQNSAFYAVNNTNAAIYSAGSSHLSYEGFTKFHYVCDSRLGQ